MSTATAVVDVIATSDMCTVHVTSKVPVTLPWTIQVYHCNFVAAFCNSPSLCQEIRYAVYYSAATPAVLLTALPVSTLLLYELCTSVYVAEHAKVQMF